MKRLSIILVMVLAFATSNAQVGILKVVDSMDDSVTYLPSSKFVVTNPEQNKGFGIQSLINKSITGISMLIVTPIGIGNCNENNTLIFKFKNGDRITVKSWNKFDCDVSYFTVTKKLYRALISDKVVKIKFQNGYTHDSLTAEVNEEDQTYFIELDEALKAKDFKLVTE